MAKRIIHGRKPASGRGVIKKKKLKPPFSIKDKGAATVLPRKTEDLRAQNKELKKKVKYETTYAKKKIVPPTTRQVRVGPGWRKITRSKLIDTSSRISEGNKASNAVHATWSSANKVAQKARLANLKHVAKYTYTNHAGKKISGWYASTHQHHLPEDQLPNKKKAIRIK